MTAPIAQVSRQPARRAIDQHLKEAVYALLAFSLGALAMLSNSARENGATQATIVGMQTQLKETTDALRAAAQNTNNLLSVIQSQALQINTLTVQVSGLNAQMVALLAQQAKK